MKSEDEAHLDVSGLTSSKALHEAIATAFEFPSYYGKNWDAFDECLSDSSLRKIKITGIASLIDALPRDASLLQICLKDYGTKTQSEIRIK
jgi:hypothetical protein